MSFHGILVHRPTDSVGADEPEECSFSADSNLDQVLASMTVGHQEDDHKPISCTPLGDAATDRLSHAAIAGTYGLSYDRMKERIAS
ncbi:MAG TPA: hypothetical protein VLW50_31720 [Streptosporangiaceae bacterium]|nr:hypothetical protein [Streptosporangiaceae bacterium]